MDLWAYLMSFLKDLMAPTPQEKHPEDLWVTLTLEGNDKLIAKLRHVEAGTPGFGTVVVPLKGYSENPTTHNMVLDWLHEHHTRTFNPSLEIEKLQRSLYDSP